MINIFLDSTVTYNDPYLTNINNGILLELVDKLGGAIYISNVVIEETKNNLKNNLQETIDKINNSLNDYNKLSNANISINIDTNIEYHIENLENYYKQGILKVVEYDNDFMPIIVERAIQGIKPFSSNKGEFRDALIWLSYTKFIKEKSLDNCFFITNNTADFYADDKQNLHNDLIHDCANIKLFKSSKSLYNFFKDEDFLNEYKSIIRYAENTVILNNWIKDNPINSDMITEILCFEYDSLIFDYLFDFLSKGHTPRNFTGYTDYYELQNYIFKDITDINYEVIDDAIYINGLIEIEASAVKKTFNFYEEDKDYILGSEDIDFELTFSLSHKGEDGTGEFEIDGISKCSIVSHFNL